MRSSVILQRALGLAAIVLFVAPAWAQLPQEAIERLGHGARVLAEAVERNRQASEAPMLAAANDVLVYRDGRVVAGVVVQLDAGAGVEVVHNAGLDVRTIVGDVVVGRIEADRLGKLAALPGVRSVELALLLEPLNDLGGDAINLPQVHAGVGLPRGYRGDGVVVGVIDTGIDITHPDFSDASGTRIEYLLEYLPDDDNQPPQAEAEWTRHDIDNAPETVTQVDINGHGTHVAGTAAGGGMANPTFIGAAPESRLVVVKATRTSDDPTRPAVFSEVDLISAVDYVFARASDLAMPAVVNLSIGRHGGPLDGTEPGVAAISDLADDGRIVVFAGGNDGAAVLHWGTELSASQTATMALDYGGAFMAPGLGQYISLTGWYEPAAVAEITLQALDQNTLAPLASITVSVGAQLDNWEPLTTTNNDVLGYTRILALTTSHPWNGDGVFQVAVTQLNDANVDLEDTIWAVSVTGDTGGQVDVWIDVRAMGSFRQEAPAIPSFVPGDTWLTLNRFGGGDQIIVAGSFSTRVSWTSGQGNLIETGQIPGRRSTFSSLGPTRDGRIRPDVLAPGSFIASALSSDAPQFGQSLQGVSQYRLAQGTSMAAPFLAGTIALMLQIDPELSVESARHLVRSTAEWAPFMGDRPNAEYGYGRLDALDAVQAALASTFVEPPPEGMLLALEQPFPNPAVTSTTLAFALAEPHSARVVLHDVLGREVRRFVDGDLRSGPHLVSVDLGGIASGVYFVSLRAGGQSVTRRLVVAR